MQAAVPQEGSGKGQGAAGQEQLTAAVSRSAVEAGGAVRLVTAPSPRLRGEGGSVEAT